MKKWVLSCTLLFAAALLAHEVRHEELCQGFAPENDVNIPVTYLAKFGGVTENEFNSVLDRIEHLYADEVKSKGSTLRVVRRWQDGTANAHADRSRGYWSITMYGGLARHDLMTPDAFALVACHEMGHHLGGAPKIKSLMRRNWASNEGQSDYYATLKCMRRYFAEDDNEQIVTNMEVDPLAAQTCEDLYTERTEQLLCIRSAMAGKHAAATLAALNNTREPHFDTPDQATVSRTQHGHPAAQCRLDTYFAGTVCTVALDQPLSDSNYRTGTCADANEYQFGLRPRCWFAPEGSNGGDRFPLPFAPESEAAL